jgi:hypothetical protein
MFSPKTRKNSFLCKSFQKRENILKKHLSPINVVSFSATLQFNPFSRMSCNLLISVHNPYHPAAPSPPFPQCPNADSLLLIEYTECQAFCPVVRIGFPQSLAHKRVLLPPIWVQVERHARLRGEGVR